MSWAKHYIEKLQRGETVAFRPSGHSMTGLVNHRDEVVVAPFQPDKGEKLTVSDVVLCKVKGSVYLHRVIQVDSRGHCLIGNNRGGINGWAAPNKIFGRLIENRGK